MSRVFNVAIFVVLMLLSYRSISSPAQLIATGLGVPWGLAWLSENSILVTDRSGKAYILDSQTGKTTNLSGVPEVYARGQGGLMDVQTDGAYLPGDWLYFTFSQDHPDGAITTVARAKLTNGALHQWQTLLSSDSHNNTSRHFGSRLAIKDGFLYVTIGDRGHRPNGQDLSVHAGKILRIHTDGRVPEDNPFVNMPEVKPEIWSYGHRNPQGICFDKHNNLWAVEHGPRGGDEVNLITKGGNYGWATVSHGREYFWPKAVGEAKSKAGMIDPVQVYIPSIAPSSMICLQDNEHPNYSVLMIGALAGQHINRITIVGNQVLSEQRLAENLNERIRALIKGPGNSVIFSTDSGKIFLQNNSFRNL